MSIITIFKKKINFFKEKIWGEQKVQITSSDKVTGSVFISILNPYRTDDRTVEGRLKGFTGKDINSTLITGVPGQNTYSDHNWKGSPGIVFASGSSLFSFFNTTDIGSDGMSWEEAPEMSKAASDLRRIMDWCRYGFSRPKSAMASAANKIDEIAIIRSGQDSTLYAPKYTSITGEPIITRRQGKFNGAAYDRRVGGSDTEIRYNESHIKAMIDAVMGVTINYEDICNLNGDPKEKTINGAITIYTALELRDKLDKIRKDAKDDQGKVDDIVEFHNKCHQYIEEKIIFLGELKDKYQKSLDDSNLPDPIELTDSFERKKGRIQAFDEHNVDNKKLWLERNIEKCGEYINDLRAEKEKHLALNNDEEIKKLLDKKMAFYIRDKTTGIITEANDANIANLRKKSEDTISRHPNPIFRSRYLVDREEKCRDFLERLIVNDFPLDKIELWFFSRFRRTEKQIPLRHIIHKNNIRKETPFLLAVKKGRLDIVEVLLDEGADINIGKVDGSKTETPLFWAVKKGRLDIVEFLLEKGADINKGEVTPKGKVTPLCLAVKNGHLDIVKFLLGKEADINKGEETPLCLAARNGHLDGHSGIVEFLLTKVSTDQIFEEIRRGNKTEAMILLEKHGLDKKNKNYDNALTVAIYNKKYDIAKELLEIDDLDINANGIFGTALMVIDYRMRSDPRDKESLKEIAKILVEKGADLTIEKGGKTIWEIAHEDLKSIIEPLQDPSSIVNSISFPFFRSNPTGR